MSNTITHKTIPPGTDRPGFVGVTPSLYAEEHKFTGGALGSVLVRDTGGSDGAGWVATLNGVLVASGVAALPTFSATLPNVVQDNITRLGAVTTATSLNVNGNFSVNTNKFNVTAASGNTTAAGTFGVTGDFAVNTNKFTVTASSGNTLVAGTLSSTGDFAVATNKFTVAASTGNTLAAGTLDATGDFRVATNKFVVTASSGNVAMAGVLSVTGAGSHVFTSASATFNQIKVENTTSGTTAQASFNIVAGTTTLAIQAASQAFTTSGSLLQAAARVLSNGVGGLSLDASDAAGVLRFYSGGSTLSGFFDSANGLFHVGAGTTATVGIEVTRNSTSRWLNVGCRESSPGAALGGTQGGASVRISHNSSGSGAAGNVKMYNLSGLGYFIWPDTSGNLRIGTSEPINAADTSGTVVGTQTSERDTKHIAGEFTSNRQALRTILHTPVYNYTYKSGAYNNSEFVGIMAEESPVFAMDNGRSFNPISAFGYTVAAIKALHDKIAKLEGKLF